MQNSLTYCSKSDEGQPFLGTRSPFSPATQVDEAAYGRPAASAGSDTVRTGIGHFNRAEGPLP